MSDQSTAHQQLLGRVRQQAVVTPQQQVTPTDPPQDDVTMFTNQQKLAAMEAALDQVEQSESSLASTPQPTATPQTEPSDVEQVPTISVPVESTPIASGVPSAPVASSTDAPQTPVVGTRQKEQIGGVGIATQELPGGMQQVEAEPTPEIPAELETFLQHVEKPDQKEVEQQLQELSAQAVAKQPQSPTTAKVLPITQKQEEEGLKKSPAFSIRWLVEFSHKLTKIFLGSVVYRQE